MQLSIPAKDHFLPVGYPGSFHEYFIFKNRGQWHTKFERNAKFPADDGIIGSPAWQISRRNLIASGPPVS
jgi:hypothetical protein